MKPFQPKPPKLATRLLVSFLRKELVEEVTGDLDERFHAELERTSMLRARLNYWYQVINYMRPFAVQRTRKRKGKHYDMFQNYWKITWRIMSRQKMYSAINIGGFAIGITACLLIGLYVRHELSYDNYYAKAADTYRVSRVSKFKGQFRNNVWMPKPLAEALLQYPEIIYAGHYVSASNLVDGRSEIRRADENENFYEDNILYGNQDLVNVFELSFISGNPARALTDAQTVIITKRKAEKYFPGEDPLGKTLILNKDDKHPLKITGVIEDFRLNTTFNPDFLLSVKDHEFWPGEASSWGSSNYFDFVVLKPGTDKREVEAKLHTLVDQYFMPDAVNNGGDANVIDWVKSLNFKLQPVSDIHLNVAEVGDNLSHGEMRYIWLFSSVAVFIIVIASINFVNLSTARSASRAKEVGLRKVVGSQRGSLIRQFLVESLVYSLMAFVVAFGLAFLLLPYFEFTVGTPLALGWQELSLVPLILFAACGVGFLAGLYPSFYLSAFKPAQIFQGAIRRGSGHKSLRSVLVICQYTISIALIIGTLVIKRQMNYMLTKKLGFDKEQILVIQSTHTLGDNIKNFKNEVEQLSDVSSSTVSGFLPVQDARRNGSGMWKGAMPAMVDRVDVQQWTVDQDYIKTLGIKLLQGRNFSPDIASDSQAIIINERLAKSLGMENPIGEVISNPWNKFTVIGVVEDFHFESMKNNISALGLLLGTNPGAVSVKLKTANVEESVARINGIWKKYAPEQPIRFTFLDQSYARTYDDVLRMGNIMTAFTILAIIVASLGLFALSAFTVEQRTKEISIRVVLGASISSILNLLTGSFVRLVVISFVVAAPLAWYLMNRWLQDYAYKIEIGWDVFVISSIIAITIALGTISFQAVKAALSNPAKSLRTE